MNEKVVTDMLFTVPQLQVRESEVIAQIEDLKKALRHQISEPRRWVGSLRRAQFARVVQGSNSIEGFIADLDDAAAIELGEHPLDASEETELAIRGYCEAMTFVLQLVDEEEFEHSGMLLKSLHFMMTSYRLDDRPGKWRVGTIYVRNDDTGEIVYEGAPVEDVPKLMGELVRTLNADDGSPPLVRAAMAHLNLAMIHPFRDGNGRMARCLQSLVLAREGILSPIFSSIEEYLGKNTPEYYAVLREVGAGRWQPNRDARPWLRFVLKAHLRQARTMLQRIKESERLWIELDELAKRKHLNERCVTALWDAAMKYRVRRSTYQAIFEEAGEEISDAIATRDLRAMVDAGLLLPKGEKRGRFYTASRELFHYREAIEAERNPRDDSDPFAADSG